MIIPTYHFLRRGFFALSVMLSGFVVGPSAMAGDRWNRPGESFVDWEDAHVHPLELSPDGNSLLAVNTPDNSLMVFAISSGTPVLQATISVSVSPVSVRARSATKAWVVNRGSNSVSVVNLTSRSVTAVIQTDTEPADVVFAGSPPRAFVTCAKTSTVNVFDRANLSAQLAKAKGAHVTGMASGRNEEFVRGLGVNEFVDYTKQFFEQVVRDMDVAFDTVGGDTFQRAFATLRKGGFLVTSVAFPKDEAQQHGVGVARVFCKPDAAELVAIRELVYAGKLKAHVSTVLPLAEIKKAFELSEGGRTRGKIVLQVGT